MGAGDTREKDDEPMTRRERLEARADKREAWAGCATAKASQALAASDMSEERTGIPFGQPIMQGRRGNPHRRTIARAQAAMARGCELAAKAEHHAQAASSIRTALDRSIFSDDPDAVEALEAKLSGLESQRAEIKTLNARCRKGDADAIEEVKHRHPQWARCGDDPARGMPAYKLTNLGGEITRCRKRIAEVKARAANVAKAEAAGGCVVTCGGGSGDWCSVTFAEKPDLGILAALRAADFRWSAPSWYGSKARLPAAVAELAHAAAQEGAG